jgi:hypothetical protein
MLNKGQVSNTYRGSGTDLRFVWNSIYFETINKLFFECVIPMPQDAGTPLFSLLQIFSQYINTIAVLENVPPMQGYRKEPPFPH